MDFIENHFPKILRRANSIDWGKFIVAVIAIAYFANNIMSPTEFRFLDTVNLFIHEAGHFLFAPFGMTLAIMGGTILQLLMPTLFVGYFFLQREFYSASLVLFWLGQNFINVSVYAGDAELMALPLIGGEIHDWNYLLTHFEVLGHTALVGKIIFIVGVMIIVLAGLSSLRFARNKVPISTIG